MGSVAPSCTLPLSCMDRCPQMHVVSEDESLIRGGNLSMQLWGSHGDCFREWGEGMGVCGHISVRNPSLMGL